MTKDQDPTPPPQEQPERPPLEARLNTYAIEHELSGQSLHRAKLAESRGTMKTVNNWRNGPEYPHPDDQQTDEEREHCEPTAAEAENYWRQRRQR